MATAFVAGIGDAVLGSRLAGITDPGYPPPPKHRVRIPSVKTLGYGQIKSIHL
jgi:hypothetical protein